MKKTIKLKSLIESCEFNYVNENIEKLFKVEKIRDKVEIKNFGRYMKSEDVIKELKKDGCLPANATELYQWVSDNKEWGKGKNQGVKALGSVVSFEGDRQVPYAWWNDAKRGAHLDWFDGFFDGDGWFAFVREFSPKSLETLKSDPLSLDLRIKNLEEDMDKIRKFLII